MLNNLRFLMVAFGFMSMIGGAVAESIVSDMDDMEEEISSELHEDDIENDDEAE